MIECDTTIESVSVFRDGARITRVGNIKLEKGQHKILVSDISRHAEADSFRVKGTGNAALKSIDTKKIVKQLVPKDRIKKLKKELDVLHTERNSVNDEIATQQERVSLLTSILNQFSSEFGKWYSIKDTPIDTLQKSHDVIIKKLEDGKNKIRELGYKLDDIENRIETIERDVEGTGSVGRKETETQVQIQLEAKMNTAVSLEISYLHRMARWEPSYDIELNSESAIIKRNANVFNQSLEDWVNAEVLVSTASMRPVEAIEPTPYYVDVSSSGVTRAKPRAVRTESSNADKEMADDRSLDTIAPSYAEVTETLGGTVQYEVPGRITIESGDDGTPLTLSKEEYPSQRMYFWNAYAMSEPVAQNVITNGDSLLLPGVARVYADGDFIGESRLGMIAPGEEVKIGTRLSYDVKCKKQLKTKDTERAGFTRGKTLREYNYEISVQSFSKQDIQIRIVDRIPHSSSENVSVEMKHSDPSPDESELGVLTWNIEIGPGDETSIMYGFEVEWEKGLILSPPLP